MDKPSLHLPFFRSLYRIRRVEEEIARVYPTDKIKSPIHLSIGQEAIAVGVCAALQPQDIVFGTYRSHALYLAKGGDLKQMIAELYGKATGCAKGKGGSMHLIAPEVGMMGTSAVVGTTIANAIGYAYALKYQRQNAIVVSFFGDGAVEEGVFSESLNFAALKQLPILFVCENNAYAIHTHQRLRQAQLNICDRARTYGIPAERIEENDLFKIYGRIATTGAQLRLGESGPGFFECMTYRWKEHVGPGEDYYLGYRTREEAQPWIDNDPLQQLAQQIDATQREAIAAEVAAEIQDAFDFAERSPFLERSELYTDVFKEPTMTKGTTHLDPNPVEDFQPFREGLKPSPTVDPIVDALNSDLAAASDRICSYVDALREATHQALATDDSTLIFGLDVDDPKAIQGTMQGLLATFGPERIFGTPLSEDAMTGAAIGMALAGLRPVHIHIRMDFLMLAMNQLVNVAAKSRYMFGGQVSVPLVVRVMIGKSWGQGAQHSQGLYALLMNIPGLKVVAPTTPYDAKGCLLAAIRDDNPVIYVEHRLLHFQTGPVPEAPYTVPPGRARVTAVGQDITLVGISYMQIECLRAQQYLLDVGIAAEVIDPIWLSPLDIKTITQSVEKTRRLCVVENGWLTCGAGAEIITQVLEQLQSKPAIEIRRLGFAPVTCPTTPVLEEHFYPNGRTIADVIHQMIKGVKWLPKERPDLKTIEFKGLF
ncbi:MAG: thiamine pyrophosphate-dependent enzyme [Cyanobacteria bacterium P01_G01_bin.54]